jgi:hypothetical protein
LLTQISGAQLGQLVIAHISEKNNCTQLVRDALSAVLPSMEAVTWANQQDGFDWLQI